MVGFRVIRWPLRHTGGILNVWTKVSNLSAVAGGPAVLGSNMATRPNNFIATNEESTKAFDLHSVAFLRFTAKLIDNWTMRT